MSVKIKRYEKDDEAALFALLRSEGDEWGDYCGSDKAVEKYKSAIDACIIYVAYSGDTLCGYIRARDDFGYGMYIYDLLVHKKYRGNSYGKLLIEQLCNDFPGTIYVMSDVDDYYKKQGYDKIEGSIIIVRE